MSLVVGKSLLDNKVRVYQREEVLLLLGVQRCLLGPRHCRGEGAASSGSGSGKRSVGKDAALRVRLTARDGGGQLTGTARSPTHSETSPIRGNPLPRLQAHHHPDVGERSLSRRTRCR